MAALVAEGLTDRQIAKRLFIAERTAEGHVQQIRNKLGFDNRAQVASWAALQGLGPGAGSLVPATAATPHNLPEQLTSFINRDHELGALRRLLQRARLLTITGPGGCGKTRLAVHAAADVMHRYPDGARFVDLSAVSDPGVVPRVLAEALGIPDREGADPVSAITAELSGHRGRWQSLVVLDNCEHLVDRCARTVEALLKGSRRLTFLCTSREPLHVVGETIWKLGPLSLPELNAAQSPAMANQSDAVRLFVDRAGLSDPEFELDETNVAEVAQLCHGVDGIPLAIELTAAHTGLMSLAELSRRLEDHIGVLRLRARPSRQRTLRATLDWSYDLLDEGERRFFGRLSVFRGGFTVEAAEAVCADPGPIGDTRAFELLSALVDKSLILPLQPRRERYRCLDSIRRYAWRRLADTDELDTIRRRHLEFFLALGERAAAELTGPEQPAWLMRLEQDHDNLRAALEFSRGQPVELRLRLVLALVQFWSIHGHVGEGREWMEDALAAAAEMGHVEIRASALNAAARLALHQGDAVQARAWLEASLVIWRALGDRGGILACLTNLGIAASRQDDWQAGRARFEEGLALARELGNPRATALLLDNLGVLAAFLGDHDGAGARLDEALGMMRSIGDPARVANSLANLGMLGLYRGRVEEASGRYGESLRILEALDAPQSVAECLEGFAWIAARRGRPERAVRLAGSAAGIREAIGTPQPPWCRRVVDECVAEARRALGSATAGLWEEGRGLAIGEAVALALEEHAGGSG